MVTLENVLSRLNHLILGNNPNQHSPSIRTLRVMDEQTVKFLKLPEEALSAFLPLEEWLPKAEYQPIGDLKLCSDPELLNHSAKLLECLPENSKVPRSKLYCRQI